MAQSLTKLASERQISISKKCNCLTKIDTFVAAYPQTQTCITRLCLGVMNSKKQTWGYTMPLTTLRRRVTDALDDRGRKERLLTKSSGRLFGVDVGVDFLDSATRGVRADERATSNWPQFEDEDRRGRRRPGPGHHGTASTATKLTKRTFYKGLFTEAGFRLHKRGHCQQARVPTWERTFDFDSIVDVRGAPDMHWHRMGWCGNNIAARWSRA